MSAPELKLRIAKMRYEQKLKNGQIAKILAAEGILSGTTNTRAMGKLMDETGIWLLQQQKALADLQGVVRPNQDLENKLKKKFGFLAVRVVEGGEVTNAGTYSALIRQYGKAAATYFDELAAAAEDKDEELHVAVSGGQTVLEMVMNLTERNRPGVHYYASAMIGRGRMTRTSHIGPETTASVAWSRSGRYPNNLFYGTVPPYDVSVNALDMEEPEKGASAEERELARHNGVRTAILSQLSDHAEHSDTAASLQDLGDSVNAAIAGIGLVQATGADAGYGSAHAERLTMTPLLRAYGISSALLAKEGAIGDFSYNLFDTKGDQFDDWHFFLTVGDDTPHAGIEFYRRLVKKRRPVIIMAGYKKWAALMPAIKTKMFNVLITDEFTARKLLEV